MFHKTIYSFAKLFTNPKCITYWFEFCTVHNWQWGTYCTKWDVQTSGFQALYCQNFINSKLHRCKYRRTGNLGYMVLVGLASYWSFYFGEGSSLHYYQSPKISVRATTDSMCWKRQQFNGHCFNMQVRGPV
jgi:hypothetical protein